MRPTKTVTKKSPWTTVLSIGIPAILAAVVILYLANRVMYPSPEPPTTATTATGALQLQAANAPLADVIGFVPSGEGNAAEDYNRAADYATEHQTELQQGREDIISNRTPQNYHKKVYAKIAELMAPALDKQQMQYTFVFTPKKLKVVFTPDGIKKLDTLADVLECLYTHYYFTGQFDKAVQIASQELVLGWHMVNERSRTGMVMDGILLQTRALLSLQNAYRKQQQTGKAEACAAYRTQLNDALDVLEKKMSSLWKLNDSSPGDAYNIIENDEDRACRVDAILALGLQKITAKGHRGNDRVRDNLLNKYAQSDDELLRAAAEAAKTCTKTQIETWFNE
ncbi:MAG: hypothetical protein KAR11_08675 [Phycisphaerae bacterium]|nr:hypothetical protein [Phycisphaerae bacterium]